MLKNYPIGVIFLKYLVYSLKQTGGKLFMNWKSFSIIALIFIIPMFAYAILSRGDMSMANKGAAGKPQIIKFTSTMCLDCKNLNGVVKEVYPKYSKQITLIEVPVQSDTAYNKQMIKKYNVTLVPTMVFLNAKGKKIARTEGSMDKTELERYMKELLK
jgi:thiol-disulfide isomerase/thioredoxin